MAEEEVEEEEEEEEEDTAGSIVLSVVMVGTTRSLSRDNSNILGSAVAGSKPLLPLLPPT